MAERQPGNPPNHVFPNRRFFLQAPLLYNLPGHIHFLDRTRYAMSVPRKLCSACLDTLQSDLEDVLQSKLYKSHAHHRTFANFQQAALQNCFVCAQYWNSIRREVLDGWKTGSVRWSPLKCSLSRRPWAPEWYGAIYWGFVYMEISLRELDMGDLNYRGNVFCLTKWSNGT